LEKLDSSSFEYDDVPGVIGFLPTSGTEYPVENILRTLLHDTWVFCIEESDHPFGSKEGVLLKRLFRTNRDGDQTLVNLFLNLLSSTTEFVLEDCRPGD
jgi:hypothetical protein